MMFTIISRSLVSIFLVALLRFTKACPECGARPFCGHIACFDGRTAKKMGSIFRVVWRFGGDFPAKIKCLWLL